MNKSAKAKLLDRYRDISDLAGVYSRCADLNSRSIGVLFRQRECLSEGLEMRHVHKIHVELFQCTRADVFREFHRNMKLVYINCVCVDQDSASLSLCISQQGYAASRH